MRGSFTTHIPDTEEVRNQVKELGLGSERYLSAKGMPDFREVSALLRECETAAHLIRSYLEYSAEESGGDEDNRTILLPAPPVKVSFEHNTLRVFTPLTFNRGIPDSYILANSIRTELQNYQQKNSRSLFWKLEPPLTVIMLRRAQKYSSRLKDNDNMETGRIINVIFPELGLSDNCMLVPDIHSGFRLVDSIEEEGMEFIVFSQKDARDHFSDLFAASSAELFQKYK